MNFKNFVAGILAVATVASMTVISFGKNDDSKDITVDNSSGFYVYDEENENFDLVENLVEPERDIYIGVAVNDTDDVISESDFGNYKISTDWDYGSKVIGKTEFTIVKVDGERTPVIRIDGKSISGLEAVDVAGKITITAKNDAVVNGGEKLSIPVEFTYGWNEILGDGYIDGGVVKFDGLDEVTLEFDGGIEFEVNAKHQKDLFIKINNKVSYELIDMYDYANLDFIGFDGSNPTFNKTGIVTIPYDAGESSPHIYNVTDSGLVEIKDCYKEDDEAFVFKTRTLGDWVISDVELTIENKELSIEDGEDDKSDENSKPLIPNKPSNDKPNPNTGANDFADVAIACIIASAVIAMLVLFHKSKDENE